MPVNALRFFVFNDKIKLELLAVPTFEGYKLPTDAANPWSVLPKETPRSLVCPYMIGLTATTPSVSTSITIPAG